MAIRTDQAFQEQRRKICGRSDFWIFYSSFLCGSPCIGSSMELTNQMHPSSCWHYFPRVSRVGPGLLVFRAATAQDTPKEDILDHNWPTMEDANARQNSFRASVYDINQMYSRSNDRIGSVQLNVKNTASHLLTLCQKELRVPISTVHDDFYSHGGRDGNLFALRLAKRAFSGFDCPVHGRDCLPASKVRSRCAPIDPVAPVKIYVR